MKLSGNYNVGGEVAKEDERYKVVDNTTLKGLVLSSTDLNPVILPADINMLVKRKFIPL